MEGGGKRGQRGLRQDGSLWLGSVMLGLLASKRWRVQPSDTSRAALNKGGGWPWALRRNLQEAGLGVAKVPQVDLQRLRLLLGQLLAAEAAVPTVAAAPAPVGLDADIVVAGRRFLRRSVCPDGSGPGAKSYYWAADAPCFDTFDLVARQITKHLEPGFELMTAAFVVVRSGSSVEGPYSFRADFESSAILKGALATALVPVWPERLPVDEGHLEWNSWGGATESHRYMCGEAAIIDGKLSHRTQPFSEAAFVSSGSAPQTGLQNLCAMASLGFVRNWDEAEAPFREELEQVLCTSGAPFRPLRALAGFSTPEKSPKRVRDRLPRIAPM
ncbi:unnamed protein product [Polarella glacialis]|uniref:Uncharacterized protein n=1 Tax=Polarella glacialis TaxID=89957 RepID=A0A813L617_POLGL|nr:unnamed protein product [Polarella glacialis]